MTDSLPSQLFRVEEYGGEPYIEHFNVTKHTRCGCWISAYWGKKKFVNSNTIKRWAYPSEKAAIESFLARKKRYLSILQHRVRCTEDAIASIERGEQPKDSSEIITFEY